MISEEVVTRVAALGGVVLTIEVTERITRARGGGSVWVAREATRARIALADGRVLDVALDAA